MANITKRTNKDGSTSYRIRVSNGFASDGSRVFKSITYTPADGETERQAEKEAARRAMAFEAQVQRGILVDTKMTLDGLLEKWFSEYAEKQLKPVTVYGYRRLVPRISAALGHLKICKIKPSHLLEFYSNLQKSGIRLDSTYTATNALVSVCSKGKRRAIYKAAGVGERTLAAVVNGANTSRPTAQKIAAAAGVPFSKAFTEHQKAEKLAGTSAHHYHLLLSSVFSTAVNWQIMQENPCERVSPPKMEDAETQFLDEKGVASLLEALPDAPEQFSVIAQLALLTGCRRGELCALRWSDINFEQGTLSVNRTLQSVPGKGMGFTPPKTKRGLRCLKLSTDTIQLLQGYRDWQTEEKLKIGSKWVRKVDIGGTMVSNDLLFTRWDGSPIDPGAVSSWFPKFLRAHNLPAVRFHSLRHTNASLLIAAHVPVTTVSGRLGHAKTSTTTDIYAACIRSSDAAAADALEDAFTRIRHQDIG